MKSMTSRDIHKAIRQGLKEVSRKLASGELDGSGRFFTDEELAASGPGARKNSKAATGAVLSAARPRRVL
jgi:hypothetical protein